MVFGRGEAEFRVLADQLDELRVRRRTREEQLRREAYPFEGFYHVRRVARLAKRDPRIGFGIDRFDHLGHIVVRPATVGFHRADREPLLERALARRFGHFLRRHVVAREHE